MAIFISIVKRVAHIFFRLLRAPLLRADYVKSTHSRFINTFFSISQIRIAANCVNFGLLEHVLLIGKIGLWDVCGTAFLNTNDSIRKIFD